VDARRDLARGLLAVMLAATGVSAASCPDDAAVVACLAAGADHYVRRAGGPDVLRANIRSQIRRKQSRDEARRVAEESMRAELVAAEARAARELADTRADLVARLTWRNEELDAFTGSVTHDLRAPLQVITLLAEELLDGGAADDDAGRAAVRRIHTAAVRMSELVDSLLLLSRASRGELRREPVDLSAQAREVAEELRRRNPDRDVEVAVADGMVAFGDPGLLRVVLENLMGNAWKFTGRTPRARVEVGWVRRGDRVEYFVRDNGVGFPRADAERVFRPFQRTHDSKEFPGTGIGLTTVHRIVDRHAGTIRADSEPGKGSVFTFTLPAAPDGNPPAAAD
ncbi:MAG TPA: HAMP domain-containing sensor histidine kinase, partial [Pilimelia sp.]|nr:HAMP domain-containing sensor histidine kinase [Pilimelia sp.]